MIDQAPSTGGLRERVVGRALTDPAFRQQLLAAPRAAIEQELKVTLPAVLEIRVVEETPTFLCLVLPMEQNALRELAEAELSGVAGGAARHIAGEGETFVLNRETGAVAFGDGASGRRLPDTAPVSAKYR
jgi:hypothetical protein